MRCKLELSLKRAAMIKLAIYIWDRKDVMKTIQEKDLFGNDSSICVEREWNVLTRDILQQLDSIPLPSVLKNEFFSVVRSIGTKIFSWVNFVLRNLQCDVILARQIYWTVYGTIDKKKIFKLLWMNNPTLDVSKVFNVACSYCDEESICTLYPQITKANPEDFIIFISSPPYMHHLNAYWMYSLDGNLSSLLGYLIRWCDYLNIYNMNHSIKENLFRLSVLEAHEIAAEYFWKQLNEKEKRRNYHSAKMAIQRCDGTWMEKKESYMHIFSFLVSEMPEEKQMELFQEYKKIILGVFLYVWPWKEFFMPTLQQLWSYFTYKDYKNLMDHISAKMIKDYRLGYTMPNNSFQKILYQVWYRSPINFKQSIDQDEWFILKRLLEMEDISSLKLIINDKVMKEQRQELINKGSQCYGALILQGKFDLINEFMQELLDSNEERQAFKETINTIYICNDFLDNYQFDLADKFLIWQLNSQDEINNFKHKLAYKHINCSCERICSTWFIDSDSITCLSLTENIQALQNGGPWKTFKELLLKGCTEMANNYINWYFEKEDAKHEYIKNFMLSEDGIKCFDTIIAGSLYVESNCQNVLKQEMLKNYKAFMKTWLKPFKGNKEQLFKRRNKLRRIIKSIEAQVTSTPNRYM